MVNDFFDRTRTENTAVNDFSAASVLDNAAVARDNRRVCFKQRQVFENLKLRPAGGNNQFDSFLLKLKQCF
jgi:hypothetical protein